MDTGDNGFRRRVAGPRFSGGMRPGPTPNPLPRRPVRAAWGGGKGEGLLSPRLKPGPVTQRNQVGACIHATVSFVSSFVLRQLTIACKQIGSLPYRPSIRRVAR